MGTHDQNYSSLLGNRLSKVPVIAYVANSGFDVGLDSGHNWFEQIFKGVQSRRAASRQDFSFIRGGSQSAVIISRTVELSREVAFVSISVFIFNRHNLYGSSSKSSEETNGNNPRIGDCGTGAWRRNTKLRSCPIIIGRTQGVK